MRQPAPLSPALVIAGANTMAGVGHRMSFEWVDRIRQRCGQSAGPWHTALVYHVGHDAHYDARAARSPWPLPATADCNELAAVAEKRGIIAESAQDGDVLLLWSGRDSRFIRSGIVVASAALNLYDDPCFDCLVVEGDTTERGALSGRGVHRLRRRIKPANGHRFLRWADLDDRHAASTRRPRFAPCVAELMAHASNRSVVCRWPHAGMSREDEVLFDWVLVHHAAFIHDTARHLARRSTVQTDDLVQEALIALWCLGPHRALAASEEFVHTTLRARMMDIRRQHAKRPTVPIPS